MELPLAPAAAPERADAARNRERILCAAERLWAQRGVGCTSMDAIAVEAGVGKGTLFRRFGDRASLARAVLDTRERELQDAVLSGPPPLGPGAPPIERIVAFGTAALAFTSEQLDLVLEAEAGSNGRWMRSPPQAVRRLHLQVLVAAARPDCDVAYVSDVLAGALSATLLAHQLRERELPLERLKAGYTDLARRLLS